MYTTNTHTLIKDTESYTFTHTYTYYTYIHRQGDTNTGALCHTYTTQKLLFQGGTTRRPIGPSSNTEPALSPRTSPSKAETSTWWQRTSTRAYSRLPRKPYQEEQEEITDHSGVKNYKTSRMHCQKPEQQLKPILHRRATPTPTSESQISQAQDTSMPKRLERKNSLPKL